MPTPVFRKCRLRLLTVGRILLLPLPRVNEQNIIDIKSLYVYKYNILYRV